MTRNIFNDCVVPDNIGSKELSFRELNQMTLDPMMLLLVDILGDSPCLLTLTSSLVFNNPYQSD